MKKIKYYLAEGFWWTLAIFGLIIVESIRFYTNIKDKFSKRK